MPPLAAYAPQTPLCIRIRGVKSDGALLFFPKTRHSQSSFGAKIDVKNKKKPRRIVPSLEQGGTIARLCAGVLACHLKSWEYVMKRRGDIVFRPIAARKKLFAQNQ